MQTIDTGFGSKIITSDDGSIQIIGKNGSRLLLNNDGGIEISANIPWNELHPNDGEAPENLIPPSDLQLSNRHGGAQIIIGVDGNITLQPAPGKDVVVSTSGAGRFVTN